MHVIVVFHL